MNCIRGAPVALWLQSRLRTSVSNPRREPEEVLLNARPRHIFYLAALTTAFVFVLATLWSYWLEHVVGHEHVGDALDAANAEHWRFVVTATLAAGAAWAISLPLCLTYVRRMRRAEEIFRHFSTTLDQTLDCVFMFRPDTLRFFYVNRGATEQVGYGRDELMRMTPIDVKPEFTESRFRALIAPLIDGSQRSCEFETVHRHKDGTLIPVEISLQYVAPEDETPRFVAIVRDVTGRKQAEEELQRSEERFRAIVNNSPAKIHIKDMAGRYLLVNPLAEQLFCVSEAECLGKTSREIFGKSQADAFMAHDQAVIDTGRPIEEEETWVEADGMHTYLTVKFPIFDQSGAMTAIGAIGTDITERKRIEAQLRQSQKMDSLGSLAGGIAHDLNNTLVPVMGLTELALEDLPEGGAGRENLEKALAGCERAKKLVAQILAFSRPQKPDRTTVELGDLIGEAVTLLRATLPTTIDIVTDLDPIVEPVLADPVQMHQVLMNLASNARQALGLKPGTLKITLRQVETGRTRMPPGIKLRAGLYAKLSISDTGPGMDQATLERIFDPFFTTKPVGEGTGMGLAVVHGIVTSHKGAIAVSSKPGRGATFEIYLPVQRALAAASAPPEAAE